MANDVDFSAFLESHSRPLETAVGGNISELPIVDDCWNKIGINGDRSCPKLKPAVHCRNCHVFMEAGERLFERAPPADCIAERTTQLAQLPPEISRSDAILIFRVGEEWTAVRVSVAVEVADPRSIHRIPHRSDNLLLGMTNVRGELHLCVSAAELLGVTSSVNPLEPANTQTKKGGGARATTARFVVIDHVGQRWVLAVDEVLGVRRIDTSAVSDTPTTVSKAPHPLAESVVICEGRRIGLLSAENLVASLKRRIG
jgi:chemotaxis-related protein WspD